MPGSRQIGETLRVAFGYSSAHFLAADSAMSVRHDNAWVAILDFPDVTLEAFVPLLEAVARSGRPLALFCSDLPDIVRDTLIVNNTHRTLLVVAIDAPSTAEYDRAQLYDVAAASGARIIASNRMLARATLEMLGETGSVTVDALATVLAGFPALR